MTAYSLGVGKCRNLTYDVWALELLAQQKCGYYIIRSIDKVLEDKAGSVRAFGEMLKTLLKDAIALWQRYHAGGVDDFFPCITKP